MAGSYSHVKGGWSLIENMGDAHEAVQELMWLIESQIGSEKARDLLKRHYYPMCRGEKPKDQALLAIELLMDK